MTDETGDGPRRESDDQPRAESRSRRGRDTASGRQSGTDPRRSGVAGSSSPRVCCCLRPGEDRRLLVEWLESHGYEPLVTSPSELAETSFDCCLVDVATLRKAEPALRAAQKKSEGLVPCLLVAPGDASEALAELPQSLAAVVTDVLGTPLRTVVLRRRLENALSARRLSTALAGSQERYRRLIEQTPAAVFLLSDDDVVYLNEAAERLLNRSATDIRGRPFAEFLTDPDRDRIASLLSDLSPGDSTSFVEASLAGSNRSIPVELAATHVASGEADAPGFDGLALGSEAPEGDVQVVAHDVSRRKAREDQLRLYRRAMDTATVGITITNPSLPDNPLVYVNEEFERLTGRSREELLGRNARVLQAPNADPDTVARIRHAIDAGEPVSVEILNQRADGTNWYNALDIAPIYGSDGEVEYFLGFQRDVTDRREREVRLAVLDRVLRHNLRNRLNVVLGHVSEIEEGTDDENIDFHAERISTAAESLLSLSDAARRFRSILRESEESTPTRLDQQAADTVSTFRGTHENARIEADFEPVTVRSGAGLTVALEELIANAIDHCDCDPEVCVTVRREGDHAVLTVADNGPGIPESERRALSGGEETPIEHASGLGLWLVRWIVDDLGGTVTYETNDPQGAVVTIRLPMADPDA